MMDVPQVTVLAEGARARLEELRLILENAGFDARIIAPPNAKPNA